MSVVPSIAAVERGRGSYARREWAQAHEALSEADRAAALGADDLELLARSAYMLGRDHEYIAALERAHRAHLDADETLPAARGAFWIGLNLFLRGETAPAMGWFARAERLVAREAGECAERGYLLTAAGLQQMAARDYEAAYLTAAEAGAIGERCDDGDLVAFARMDQGCALLNLGRNEEGRRLVDEAMVSVTAGELSPIAAGLVYCNTISFCQDTHELRRAREWTVALSRWCDQQPEMVAHTGICHVHRAELMALGGDWDDALSELRRFGERLGGGTVNQRAMGTAAYQQGELRRLRGDFAAAEEAYREASRLGREPQPGLALLRLAQGNVGSAGASIRRALGEAEQPLKRGTLLPAYVEITLAEGDVEAARVARDELEEITRGHHSHALLAAAAQAEGAVRLAEGDADAALAATRRAWDRWEELDAPYEAARARVLVGLACRELGDEDTAQLELEAAGEVFAALGASPDLAALESLGEPRERGDAAGLTARELEVLRLVAAGRTNREIASALTISEHTAARHLQNIFAKLHVSSRTAASAFAFEHHLL
jgi:DNA-binding CsgD family transcriptional regulator